MGFSYMRRFKRINHSHAHISSSHDPSLERGRSTRARAMASRGGRDATTFPPLSASQLAVTMAYVRDGDATRVFYLLWTSSRAVDDRRARGDGASGRWMDAARVLGSSRTRARAVMRRVERDGAR